MIRVVIVDDEAMARAKLRRLLGAHADVEIVAEAHDVASAARAVAEHRPGLVFLDIDMPRADGFALVRALEPPLPRIVFATAYSEFAVRAFEVEAFDYLLKPFDAERLGRVLERVRTQLGAREAPTLEALAALIERLERPTGERSGGGEAWATRVLVEHGGEMRFVRVGDVRWFASADNYVELHAADGVHLVRDTLAAVERRLDPGTFLRVHRTSIVNLDHVTAIRSRASGQLEVCFAGGDAVPVGRAHQAALTKRWHGRGHSGG